eukprot:10187436-Ditylum_brightwellii.AAC.1
MQKPSFEKALKALAKKYVLTGGFKSDSRMTSSLDLLVTEYEIAEKTLKMQRRFNTMINYYLPILYWKGNEDIE